MGTCIFVVPDVAGTQKTEGYSMNLQSLINRIQARESSAITGASNLTVNSHVDTPMGKKTRVVLTVTDATGRLFPWAVLDFGPGGGIDLPEHGSYPVADDAATWGDEFAANPREARKHMRALLVTPAPAPAPAPAKVETTIVTAPAPAPNPFGDVPVIEQAPAPAPKVELVEAEHVGAYHVPDADNLGEVLSSVVFAKPHKGKKVA